MRSAAGTLFGAAMLAMVRGQGVVLKAVGDSGTSLGLQVQQGAADANLISAAEINANIVNECGRTMLGGNIDIGEKTEDALAAGNVTTVTQGSTVKMTIDQVNATGAGPFTCDLDPQGNTLATGQTNLTVKETDKAGTTTLAITMPKDLACSGSSAGNVCTIRCKNAQDFGGCVAVQQTDVTPLAGDNPPSNITIAASLAVIEAQVQQDQKDLPAAIAGNQAATSVDQQGVKIASALLAAEPGVVAAQKAEVATAGTAAAGAANNNAAGNTKNGGGNTKNGGGATKNAGAANAGATKNAGAAKNNNAAAGKKGQRSELHARRFQRGRRYVAAGAAFDEGAGN